MKLVRWTMAAAGLALAGGLCIADETPKPRAPNMDSITLKDIKRDVYFLASDEMAGRDTATAESRIASGYVKTRMEQAGVKPAGEKDGWFQEVRFRYFQWDGKPTLTVKVGDQNSEQAYEKDFIGAEGPGESCEIKDAPLAFAGYAINDQQRKYNDLEGVDLKGKIALVLRYEPSPWAREGRRGPGRGAGLRNKANQCRRAGAVGMLVVTGPASLGASDDRRDLPSPGNTEKSPPLRLDLPVTPASAGEPARTPFPMFHITVNLADKLLGAEGKLKGLQAEFDQGKFESRPDLKDTTASIALKSIPVTKTDRNVTGMIQGEVDEWIILGGHHDHLGLGYFGSNDKAENQGKVHNGADDNATGVSTILEIAEAIATSGKKPRRSLLFMTFTGEEKGLLGANWYVRHPLIPHNKVVAMINIDMIGRITDKKYTMEGAGACPLLDRLCKEAAPLFPQVNFPTTKRIIPASDHWPFYSLAGVPVVFPFDNENKGIYHTTQDDPETINYDDMLVAVKMVYEVLWRLSEHKGYATYSGPVKGSIGPDGKLRNPKEAEPEKPKEAEPKAPDPKTPEKKEPGKRGEEFSG